MPIREIRDKELDQECGKCARVSTIVFADLEVGVARGKQIDPKIIGLPACPGCGAREYLVRSSENEEHPSPGTYGHLHRLLVDTLHTRLLKTNRALAGIDAKAEGPHALSAETTNRWFPDGLKLSRPLTDDKGEQ